MNDFGVRVFPSSSSNAIRNSVKVLHYAPAPADPPIDYTLRVKPNSNAVPTIPWKSGNKSTSAPQQHVNNWSKQRQSSAENSNLRRYPTENGPAAVEKFRDTVEESASVLEDLDHLLDSEELTLQQRMSRLEIRRGHPLPNSIPAAGAAKEREERRYSHQIPVKSNFRLRRENSTEKSPFEPVPLRPQRPQRRIAPQRVSSYGEDVSNERRKSMVEDMYKETERRIDEAIHLYTPEYFKERMTLSPTLPLWKCELMARKLSNETIEKIQEDAWRDFAEWKRLHAPSITIQPTWRNKRQPMLP